MDESEPRSSRLDSRHVHRDAGGTSPSTCSTWLPQPANVGFPHEEHFTRWHILITSVRGATSAPCRVRATPAEKDS